MYIQRKQFSIRKQISDLSWISQRFPVGTIKGALMEFELYFVFSCFTYHIVCGDLSRITAAGDTPS